MEKINLESFLDYRFLSNLKSNPSKTKFAFLSAKAKLEKNEYYYDLYVSDGNQTKKVVAIKKSSAFIWETDQTILFSHTKNKAEEKMVKDKKTIYYRYDLAKKTMEKAYEFPFPTSIHTVLNDQELLLSASLSPLDHKLYQADEKSRKEIIKDQEKNEVYEEINEIPFYFNGLGFIANKRKQLFIYDIKGETYKPLVDPDFSVGEIYVTSDHQHIYYTGEEMTGVKSLTTHVYVFHKGIQRTEKLYGNDDYSIDHLQLIKNRLVVAASDMKTYGNNQNSDFYIIENQMMIPLAKFTYGLGNSVGSDVRLGGSSTYLSAHDAFYFVATVDDHNELFKLNLDGKIHPVYKMKGSIDGLVFIKESLFIIGLYQQKLQEIYQLDIPELKLIQKTNLNRKFLKNKYVAKPKMYVYKDRSHEVKGFVLYPKDYQSDKQYPAILDIHGGPKTVYGQVYYHEMQHWANQGYFVMFANPRGSDGKGDGFSDIRGKYGTIDYDDLMHFTDLVISKIPSIDQEQIFVTGGSYGGYMTNWIVTQTIRFKAAATQRSISNWLSFHGTSDIGFYFSKDQTGGHPVEDTLTLWNQSPMKYAKNVKTPLLFIHSDQDYRCPIEQAMQFYTIIKENGTKTKLVWFKGENHELSRGGKPQARIKRLSEITSWFDQYKK